MADQSSPSPPEPTSDELSAIVTLVKDWTISNGLAVRPPPAVVAQDLDPNGILATSAPVTLFPSPFPRVCFEQAVSIQKAYNHLYAKISQDEAFLKDIVEEIAEVDQFIADLWNVHLRVQSLGGGYAQDLALGLFRSDYMVHQDLETANSKPTIKQVEFNTIASSFGGLSTQTSKLHRYLAQTVYPALTNHKIKLPNLPENNSIDSLAEGLRAAHASYKRTSKYPTCILFIVQDGERNICDQRHLEYALTPFNVFRLPFSEILEHATVSQEGRELLYVPPHFPNLIYEVSVVYFRAGYGPDDYPNQDAWDARYQIEVSRAIKCPSVLTQLAGAKKVQQVLATPISPDTTSIMSKFVSDTKTRVELEDTFTNIYPLDDTPAGLAARELALDEEKCKAYVLKPQREGGGNNIYRSNIPPFLKSIPKENWKSYILMELITPPPVRNLILRNGNVEQGGVICELGIYGTCLWDQRTGEIRRNENAGYLLRTKGDKSEEGGVAAGFGSMDSVMLVQLS